MRKGRKRQADFELEDSLKYLRSILKPGATIYTACWHVSRSGALRHIDLYVVRKNVPICISHSVGRILDIKRNAHGAGLVVHGGGMDMGHHLVYELGRIMYPRGFIPAKAGQKYGRNGVSADKRDQDGGYALEHRWL